MESRGGRKNLLLIYFASLERAYTAYTCVCMLHDGTPGRKSGQSRRARTGGPSRDLHRTRTRVAPQNRNRNQKQKKMKRK